MLSAVRLKHIEGLGLKEPSLFHIIGKRGRYMLTVDDLINITYIPSEEDISMQLYLDFYEQYLCKRIYIFTLENGERIKLFFKDATEIFHVSGIEHIYAGIPMNGKRFIELIKDKKVGMAQLKTINANVYKDYIDRICSFACIDTLLKNCEYLWYKDGVIPKSTIKVKYLLLKGIDGKNIHLGIDTYNQNRPFFSKTLLVTEGNTVNKFINKADERLHVSKIEIIEKDTDSLIELINRDTAEKNTVEIIDRKLLEWEKEKLADSLGRFCASIANEIELMNKISDLLLKHCEKLCLDADTLLSKNTEILIILQEIAIAEEIEIKEWERLLLEVVEEIICTNSLNGDFWEDSVLEYCCDDLIDYLHTYKRRFIKLVAIPEIKSLLNSEKQNIRDEIDKFDRYRCGKIVGDQIRKKEKEYIKHSLEDAIKVLIDNNKKIIIEILLKYMPKGHKEKLNNEYIELIYSKLIETKRAKKE